MKRKKGIALIMAIGILALLAAIGATFALNMRLEYKAALNYLKGVQARYYADAGIQIAMMRLKAHIYNSAFDDLGEEWADNGYSEDFYEKADWNQYEYKHEKDEICGQFSAAIVDEQRKVNVNNANERLLKNLCGLIGESLSDADGTVIFQKRPVADGGYTGIEGLKRAFMDAGDAEDTAEAKFEDLAPYVTTTSYVDPNADNPDSNENDNVVARSPVNVNTCDELVLEAILFNLSDGTNPIEDTNEVGDVAADIIALRPITSWGQFDAIIDGLAISSEKKDIIKTNCNPNRLKDDLTATTTELCFHAGGRYTIESTGSVLDGGSVIAQKTVTAIVKVNDVYTETTQAQFEAGTPVRVTWLDSCPVDSADLFGSYEIPDDAETIPGSLKLGFWDDFEDLDYSGDEWRTTGDTRVFMDVDEDEDVELTNENLNDWPTHSLKDLDNTEKWEWEDFSMRVFEYDTQSVSGLQMREVGQIKFRGSAAALHAHDGDLAWGNKWAYLKPFPPYDLIFLDDTEARGDPYYFDPETDKYEYGAQIRFFSSQEANADENDDTDTYRTLMSYKNKKTYNLYVNDTYLYLEVWTDDSNMSFSRYIDSGLDDSDCIALYGDKMRAAWDDIRIIPPNGNYTSKGITLADMTDTGVVWAMMTATATFPGSADPSSEEFYFEYSLGLDCWDRNTDYENSAIVPLRSSSPSPSTKDLYYRAHLNTPADGSFQNTPVIEDVTVTGFSKIKTLKYSVSP